MSINIRLGVRRLLALPFSPEDDVEESDVGVYVLIIGEERICTTLQ